MYQMITWDKMMKRDDDALMITGHQATKEMVALVDPEIAIFFCELCNSFLMDS